MVFLGQTLAALAALSVGVGCSCPKCANAVHANNADAAPPAGPDGKRLVLWDGAHIKPRNVGTGRTGRLDYWDGGRGWAGCNRKPTCVASLEAATGAGLHGGKGLKFHGEGPGWIGAGWSWFGWYPPTAGSDLSSFDRLVFEIRVEGTAPRSRPRPGEAGDVPSDAAAGAESLNVALISSDGKKASARVSLRKYDEGFADAAWHRVAIPLADLTHTAEAQGFNLKSVWELQLTTWSEAPRAFDVYVDQIAAER